MILRYIATLIVALLATYDAEADTMCCYVASAPTAEHSEPCFEIGKAEMPFVSPSAMLRL